MRRGTDRRGYVVLEASIFLPIFIIAILAIGYYIKIFGIMENVAYSVMDETGKAASVAYVSRSAPLFENVLESRVKSDSPNLKDLDIYGVRYLYYDGDTDDLISVKTGYTIETPFPFGMDHSVEVDMRFKSRGFTGVKSSGSPMTFDEMESEGVWDPVWVFPASGKKYHEKTCTYVVSNARETVLTADVKRRFSPCSLCGADKVHIGDFVYCFMETGSVYHKEECKQVTRYTVEMNRDDAINKGYIPCSKCGGG